MTLLELTRDTRGIIWIAVLFAMAGSAYRENFKAARFPDDALWALFFYVAIAILGYNARWLLGIAAPPASDIDVQTRLALNVLLSLTGLGILYKRWVREGWRW